MPTPWRIAIVILLVLGLIIGILVFIGLILLGYGVDWTGFNAHIGPHVQQYQPAKTLWDWMQLLIIPIVLAIGVTLFNRMLDRTNREIAFEKQQEDALQDYLDKIAELLLDRDLRGAKQGDEVYYIAQLRTLAVVPRLNIGRRMSLIRFLYGGPHCQDTKTGSNKSYCPPFLFCCSVFSLCLAYAL